MARRTAGRIIRELQPAAAGVPEVLYRPTGEETEGYPTQIAITQVGAGTREATLYIVPDGGSVTDPWMRVRLGGARAFSALISLIGLELHGFAIHC